MKKLISALSIAVLLTTGLSSPSFASTANSVPNSWGLDRIDQLSNELDNSYTRPQSGGKGVRVYVLDTGVQGDLLSFGGRVETGYDATSVYGGTANTDCHGHGTHVAGTIASSEYGVAPNATIVPVRVATCRGGVSSTWIYRALEWVLNNHPKGTPGVVNMSVAVRYNENINNMADRLYREGLVVVAAAGNYNMDACRLSPGSTGAILTVGSININSYKTNRTTYGDCIDIYAPGGLIVSEDPFSSQKTRTGTSMASPHVAGAAALYLADHPTDSAATFNHLVTRYATEGAIGNWTSNDGANKILNIGFINERSASAGSESPSEVVVEEEPIFEEEIVEEAPEIVQTLADSPRNFQVFAGSSNMVFVWNAPVNAEQVSIDHYRVEYSYNNGMTWRMLTRVDSSETQATYRKPRRGLRVTFRVFAVTEAGLSPSSNEVLIRVP